MATQWRYRYVWIFIIYFWIIKKSPSPVKARSTRKVENTQFLSYYGAIPNDRMVYFHAVIFVFLCCHGAAGHSMGARSRPRCRSPPYPPKIWNLAHHQILGGSTMDKKRLYIAFHKNIFNPPNGWAVYLLSLASESDGRGSEHDPNWAPAKAAGSAVYKAARYLRQFGAWVPCR